MYKAVIFDAFGTLISTGTGSVDATQKILDRSGSDIYARSFYAHWKRLHNIYTKCENGFLTEEKLFALELKWLYEYYGICSDYRADVHIMLDSRYHRKAFDDSLASLDYLRRFYQVYIGSNTDTEPLLQNLRNNGIYVDGVFTSESLRVYKPDIRFYRSILEHIQREPSEVVFIGDSLVDDVLGPQRAGIPAILLDRTHTYDPDTSDIKPERVIGALPRGRLEGEIHSQ